MGKGIDAAVFERLLAQSGWMRSLARDLCRDQAAAEDLVQEAWVAALRRPPLEGASPRAFLGRVIANLSRARHRSEAARRGREERSARPEALPSAADVVERASSCRRMVEHVLALEEPYRSTVLSRYFDELSAEEIAARDAVTSSTVRTRLARGLAQLRERLERAEGRAWVVLAGTIAGHATVPMTTAGSIGAGLGGALAMGSLVKVGIGTGLAIALTWIAWPERKPEVVPAQRLAEAPSAPELTPHTPLAQRTALAAAAKPDPAPSPAEPRGGGLTEELTKEEIETLATEVPPLTIEGIVLRGVTQVTHGTVWCWPYWDKLPERPREGWQGPEQDERFERLMRAELDERGCFRFDGLEPNEPPHETYRLGVDLGEGPRCETFVQVLTDRPTQRVVIVLGTARIEGHVYDEEGRPVADKWVEVSTDTLRGAHRALFTGQRTDEAGAFALEDLTADFYWLTLRADAAGGDDELMQFLPRLAEGETRVVDVGRLARAAVWTGTVRARTGDFVPGPGRFAVDDHDDSSYREVEFDEQGRFRVALQPGRYEPRMLRALSAHPSELPPVTIGETDLELDLVMPGTRLAGVVHERAGAMWSYDRAVVEVRVHKEGEDLPDEYVQVDAGADGRFVFDGLEPGNWVVVTRFVRVADGQRVEVPGEGLRGYRFRVAEGDIEVPLELTLRMP